jgi:hypothetical protein
LNICNACDIGYKNSKNQCLHVEVTLLRLCEIGVEKKKSEQPVAATSSLTSAPATALKPVQIPALPHISIKEALAATPPAVSVQPTTAQTVQPQKLQEELITQEILMEAWTSFAEKYKAEPRLYDLLTAQTPQLGENATINFTIISTLQQEAFQKIDAALIGYLREQLNNSKIKINPVSPEKQDTHKAYTAEDKFAQMCQKNPALLTFKQRFMLDFD